MYWAGNTVWLSTGISLRDNRLISEGVRDVSTSMSPRQHKCDVQNYTTHRVPLRRLCAVVNGEPFSPPCRPRSFPKLVSGTCFSSFCPQTWRTGIRGEVCLVPTGAAAASNVDVFLHECQPHSPLQTNINKHRRWGKSLRVPLTTCLLRHVGERKRRHVRSRAAAVRQQGRREGEECPRGRAPSSCTCLLNSYTQILAWAGILYYTHMSVWFVGYKGQL